MRRLLRRKPAAIIANGVGLLLAEALLTGFSTNPVSFIVLVLVFTEFLLLIGPLLTWLATHSIPVLRGSVPLVAVFLVLKITDWFVVGFDMGASSDWLAATLIVWLGSLIAQIILSPYVSEELRDGSDHDAATG
jgi:hypothetical protein